MGAVRERAVGWSTLLVTVIGGVLPRIDLRLHPLLASKMERCSEVRVRVLASFVRASYCSCNLGGRSIYVKFCATNLKNDDPFVSAESSGADWNRAVSVLPAPSGRINHARP